MLPKLRAAGRIAALVLKMPGLLLRTQLQYLAFGRAFRRSAQAFGLPPEAIRQMHRDMRPTALLRAVGARAKQKAAG